MVGITKREVGCSHQQGGAAQDAGPSTPARNWPWRPTSRDDIATHGHLDARFPFWGLYASVGASRPLGSTAVKLPAGPSLGYFQAGWPKCA